MLDVEITKKIKDFWRAGLDGNAQYRAKVMERRRFYIGQQWDQADLELLRQQGRPALTVNRILPIINALSGVQRQNRQQFKCFARRGGTAAVAEVLTALIRHTMDVNHADWTVSLWCLQGLIDAKSWIGLAFDYQNDPENGDVKIVTRDSLNVIEDREGDGYDVNDGCKYVIVRQWMDKDELKLTYGQDYADVARWVEGDVSWMDRESGAGDYERVGWTDGAGTDPKFRVAYLETYWKEMAKIWYLVDRETLEFVRVKGRDKTAAQTLVAYDPDRYALVDRIGPVMHVARTIGDIVLEHIEDPFHGLVMFPWVRFCPFWLDDPNGGGLVFGIIDNLRDAQCEHNKRRSQALHHLNSTANSGYLVEEGSLDPIQEQNLEFFGSKPGMNIRYRRGSTPPHRIEPAQLSQGHMMLADAAANDMKEISGVNADLMGHKSERVESGVAMKLRMTQGLGINEMVFDNFEWSMQCFGTALMQFIRAGRGDRLSYLYSDEEIRSVIDTAKLNVDLAAIRSFRTGRYGVKVDQAANAPTQRYAQFLELMDLAKIAPIPPEYLIEASDYAKKDEIIEAIKAERNPAPVPGGPGPSGVSQVAGR